MTVLAEKEYKEKKRKEEKRKEKQDLVVRSKKEMALPGRCSPKVCLKKAVSTEIGTIIFRLLSDKVGPHSSDNPTLGTKAHKNDMD